MRWIDDHCHLDPTDLGQAEIDEAATQGVHRFITVGCDESTSRQCIAAAQRHENVWATVGVHPHEAQFGIEGILSLIDTPRVVAIGEAGLDYHYDHSPRDIQRAIFAAQIALANERGLPLVVHSRESWDDTFSVLDAEGVPARIVFHCFTGGAAEAQECLDRGALLSISGIVTFPSAHDVREAVAITPLERLLVETDSPYLAPVPHRGRKNQPGHVAVVGAKVAEVKGVTVETVAAATWDTAARFYGLPQI
jgi:TatD DNase family protein